MINRIEYLKEEIRKHNYLYYALDSPELSDGAYDALFKELKELESVYPELKTGDSPTVMVGYKGLANFTLSNRNQINKPLNGKTYVITGCMSKPRSEIIKEIEDLGGIVKDQVTAHTTAIIVGENAGSKLNKAKTLNIPILSEDKLYQLLNT